MSAKPDADLVIKALNRAYEMHGRPQDVLIHSDQGSHMAPVVSFSGSSIPDDAKHESTSQLLRQRPMERHYTNGLPLPDDAPMEPPPKVQELRDIVLRSKGQVSRSPERHGAMSAVFKAQIGWIPLSLVAVKPSQGKTLTVMQVWLALVQRGQSTARAGPLERMFTFPNLNQAMMLGMP